MSCLSRAGILEKSWRVAVLNQAGGQAISVSQPATPAAGEINHCRHDSWHAPGCNTHSGAGPQAFRVTKRARLSRRVALSFDSAANQHTLYARSAVRSAQPAMTESQHSCTAVALVHLEMSSYKGPSPEFDMTGSPRRKNLMADSDSASNCGRMVKLIPHSGVLQNPSDCSAVCQ